VERKNSSEDFLSKIFERSEDPMAELERVNSIVPIFFADKKNVAFANKKLDSYGYQINDDYISQMRNYIEMFGHPSCTSDNDYDYGYGSNHPSCTSSNGYGSGHPSCCSSQNQRGRSLFLIKKDNSGRYNETRN